MAGLISGYIQHFSYAGLFLALVLCGMGLPVPKDIALLAGAALFYLSRVPLLERSALRTRTE